MVEDRLKDMKRRMDGAAKALASEFQTVRTGRALDRAPRPRRRRRLRDAAHPLNQLATINAPEPRLLTVQPYDRSIMASVEKAIMESDLGLTPNNDGQIIRLPVPELTEERRKEMVRLVHKMAEEARVAVRNVRRDVLNEMKRAEKSGELSRDERLAGPGRGPKLTDAEVEAIDDLMARKKAEILEV